MNRVGLVMWVVRAIGMAVIAIAAINVANSEPPAAATLHPGAAYEASEDELALVKAGDKLNQKNTDNVYQQAVVNGWVARDLLDLQVQQLDKLGEAISDTTYVLPAKSDDRPVRLLMFAVIAVCWFGATTPALWSKAAQSQEPEARDTHSAEAV